MSINWKKIVSFLLLVATIVAVVLYFHYRHKPEPTQVFTPAPATVKFATVKLRHWPEVVRATGNVSALRGVTLRAQVSGQIIQQYVDSASQVKEGQPIYQIDPQGLAQLIQQNQATLTLKRAQLDEQQKLYKQKFVSKNDYDTAKANYEVALDTLKQNEHKLLMTKVVAPFAGRIGVTLVHEGEFVSVNQPLVSVQNLDNLRIDFTVSGIEAAKVKTGQKVLFELSQYPSKIFQATVAAKNPNINSQNLSLLVRAEITKTDANIIPGAFANVQLYVSNSLTFLTVPQTAVVYSNNGIGVYRVINGVAQLTSVTLGPRLQNQIAILKGLKAGDVVVAEGKIKLMDGAHVTEAK